MKPLFLFLALSWLQAGLPANKTKARPAPIEPDVTTNNNGGFRAAPQEVKIIVEHKEPEPKKEIPAENTPKDIPVPNNIAPIMLKSAWQADANGNFWVKAANGALFYGSDKTSLRAYGEPYNP